MKRKQTLMRLLLIGLISVTTAFSCKKNVDNVVVADYIYTNTTNSLITVTSYNDGNDFVYNISGGDSLKISEDLMAGNNEFKIVDADSVKISLNTNTICFYPETASSRNLIKLENYRYTLAGKNRHQYRFSFSADDFGG